MKNFSSFQQKIAFFLIVVFAACVATVDLYSFSTNQERKMEASNQSTDSTVIRFMPIGDSYTIGNGVQVPERWPNMMVQNLKKEGIEMELVGNPAVSGYDAEDAIAHELPLFEKVRPDFGTLFIGANDSFRGRDLEIFRDNYVELLERMQKALTNKENLVVITVPNYAHFPQARGYNVGAEDIEGYNRIIREEAGKRNLKVVDLYQINELSSDDYFIYDGIHPSPKGIKVWHDEILSVVKEVVKK